jgi:hypothetical protein
VKTPPDICPHCGAEVPRNARACPDCGSDEQTGWSEQAANDHLGLPDDSFDYERFVREEFGEEKGPRTRDPRGHWIAVAVVILLLAGFLLLLR